MRPQRIRIARLGEGQIDLRQRLDGAHDAAGLLAHQPRQRRQDAPDFLRFGQLQLAPGVVQVHRGQRLDEERGARGRLVVHQAADAVLEVGLERDHVAPIALGDDRLLQVGAVLRIGDDALELLQQAVVGQPQVAPDVGQLVRGRVEHLAALVERHADRLHQAGRLFDALRQRRQRGELVGQPAEDALHGAAGDERVLHVQHFARLEHRADGGRLGVSPHIARAADSQLGLHRQQPARLAGRLLPAAGLVQVGRRRQLQGQGRAGREGGEFAQPVEDLGQLESVD